MAIGANQPGILKRVEDWWSRALPWSKQVTFSFILCALVLRVIILALGFDRLTAFDVWKYPIGQALMVVSGLIAGVFAARGWFAPENPGDDRVAHWRRDRVGIWWSLGAGSTVVQAVVVAWLCESCLGVVAQYLDGSVNVRRGTVISLRPTYTPATVCKWRLVVRLETGDRTLSVCLKTAMHDALSPVPLAVGETVNVRLRMTPLGSVIDSIKPSGV